MKGFVRAVVFKDADERQRFAEEAWTSLQTARGDRRVVGQSTFFLGEFTSAHDNRSGRATVIFELQRNVLTADATDLQPGEVKQVERKECERVHFFLLASGYVVIESPRLATKEMSTRVAVQRASEAVLQVLCDAFEVTFYVAHGERENTFFVERVLEAARSDSTRLRRVQVHGFAGKKIPPGLKLFNPKDIPEQQLRAVFDEIADGLASADFVADAHGDLSHAAIVRGATFTGVVDRIEEQHAPPTNKRRWSRKVFNRVRTDVVEVPGGARTPPHTLTPRLSAAVSEGDYDPPEQPDGDAE